MLLAQNPVNHKRSKHIQIKYHWICEKENDGMVRLVHVLTAMGMAAGMMTKALPHKGHYTKHIYEVSGVLMPLCHDIAY